MFSLRKLSGLGSFAAFGGKVTSSAAPQNGVNGLSESGSSSASDPTTVVREDDSEGSPQEEDAGAVQAGVLTYNFAEVVVVVDLATHTAFSTAPDAATHLRPRAQPTAHALFHGDRLRLVVGCVNGEVALWEDVAAAHQKESGGTAKRSRTGGSASSGSAPAAVVMSNSSASTSVFSGASFEKPTLSNPLSSGSVAQSYVLFNRDGSINSSRVVAIHWLPGPGCRFVAVHMDGALIFYDTRLKKAASASATNEAVAAAAAASAAANAAANAAAVSASSPQSAYYHPEPSNGFSASEAGLPNGNSSGTSSASDGTGCYGAAGVTSGMNSLSAANGFMSSLATMTGRGDAAPSVASASTMNGGSTSIGERSSERSSLVDHGASSLERPPSGHRRSSSLATGSASILGIHDVSASRPPRGKRTNPFMVWQMGCGPIMDAAFSPNASTPGEPLLLAVASRDGYLRIVDVTRESVVVAFRSYFGAILCTSWSPDGRYVAAGGEDDLVSIWCPAEERIIARCEGHTSWVSSVAWDAHLCRDGRYRLGSAGQDAKLLLWDFERDTLVKRSSKTLHRLRSTTTSHDGSFTTPPRAPNGAPHAHTNGAAHANGHAQPAATAVSGAALTGTFNPVYQTSGAPPVPEKRVGKLARLRGHATGSGASRDDAEPHQTLAVPGTVIGALGRADVPVVEPVLAHVAHVEPLTDVRFLDTGVVTADCVGNVKLWVRPPQEHIPPLSLGAAPQPDLD